MLESEYNKIDGVRSTALVALKKSPKHYRLALETDIEDTPELRIGRAVHCYALEGAIVFGQRFVCYREDKSKGEGSRKRWQAFQEENANRTILDVKEYDRALGAAKALLDHPLASRYLAGGVKEHTIQWTDRETGIRCKARVDCANRHLVDVKSARDVQPRLFAADCARLSYHTRMAFYLDGAIANRMKVDPDPIITAVENKLPHDVVCYRLGPEVTDVGRKEYRALLRLLKTCQERDHWPGMAPDDVIELELPVWALPEDEERELTLPDGERMSI